MAFMQHFMGEHGYKKTTLTVNYQKMTVVTLTKLAVGLSDDLPNAFLVVMKMAVKWAL